MSPSTKFTFDTEFRADSDVVSPAARARRKQTMTVEEIESMLARAQAEGAQAGQVRASEHIERTVAALTIALRAARDQSAAQIEAGGKEAADLALAPPKNLAAAALSALPAGDGE